MKFLKKKHYEITSDNFIFEKMSSSEKPYNLKVKKCIICNEPTIGTICEKESCYIKFEKL